MALPIVSSVRSSSSTTVGYCLIIAAAALFALIHVIGKPLVGSTESAGFEIHPIALAATIYIINGLFFTPLAKNSKPIRSMGNKNLILIGIIGVAEVSAIITYFFGLKDSSAINASIFSNGEIIFSLLLAITIFRERLQRKELTPFFMIIFGMMILPVAYDMHLHGMTLSTFVLGDLLIILSGLFYAIDINICKYVSNKFDSKRITQLVSFSAGGFALVLLVAFQIPFDVSWESMPPIAVIAILGTGTSTLFFIMALRLIGAVRTILLYSTTSIFGVIFSGIVLHEQITIVNIISITTVMLGIYLLRNKLGGEARPDDHTKLLEPATRQPTPISSQLKLREPTMQQTILEITNGNDGRRSVLLFPSAHFSKEDQQKRTEKSTKNKVRLRLLSRLYEGG